MAGVIGSEELVEFTVIGSTVNLASRVEHLTRRHATDILITAAVREALDARFALHELPAAGVAGISEPVVTYAVEGVLPGQVEPSTLLLRLAAAPLLRLGTGPPSHRLLRQGS